MATVEFKHVEKRFDDRTRAIKDLSLSIEDGEFLVLLGPSGCGKSTLLRMLAGLEEATAGEIRVGGEIVNDRGPQQRNVAMIFQNYALYPHMTVRQNLAFPLRMLKLGNEAIEEKVKDAAQLLGLGDLLDRKPKQLSGGQAQRVAMGRAIVRQPSVFLMDEPLSNLDAKMRVEIRTEIAALQRRLGTTTLYVTHDQTEAMTLGSRVAVLRSGELQQVSPPQELYERPANVFVASFIGSPPMNVFETRIRREDDRCFLEFGSQRIQAPVRQAWPNSESGETLLAGLRPESFFWPEQNSELPCIQVEVVSIEYLGHEQVVYFKSPVPTMNLREDSLSEPVARTPADNAVLAARLLNPRKVEMESHISLALDPGKMHWFDSKGQPLASP